MLPVRENSVIVLEIRPQQVLLYNKTTLLYLTPDKHHGLYTVHKQIP